MKAARMLLAYLPAMIWAAYLLFIGGQPLDEPLPQLPFSLPSDKIGHFILYGGLGFFAVLGWRWARRRPAIWVPIVLSIAVGVVDELHQRSVPTRSADIRDWLVDVVAISVAFAVFRRTPSRNRKQ